MATQAVPLSVDQTQAVARNPEQPQLAVGKSIRKQTLSTLLAQHRDIRCLALAAAIVTYSPGADGEWFDGPSLEKLANIFGIRDPRTVKALLDELVASGTVETKLKRVFNEKWTSTRSFLIVRSDGPPDFVPVSRKWFYDHADLGATGIGLYLMDEVMAGRRRSLRDTVDNLVSASGLSRNTYDKYARLIEACGLTETSHCRPEVEIAMTQNRRTSQNLHPTQPDPTSQNLHVTQPSSQNLHPIPAPTSQNLQSTPHPTSQNLHPMTSQNLRDKYSTEPKPSTGSKDSTESKSKPTHDMRRAENRADASATSLIVLPSKVPEPPAPPTLDAEPPTHDKCTCEDGYFHFKDKAGRTSSKQCPRWIAWQKWLIAEEKATKERELMASYAGRSGFDFFRDMLPSLNPTQWQLPATSDTFNEARTIEGEGKMLALPPASNNEQPFITRDSRIRVKAGRSLTTQEYADFKASIESRFRGLELKTLKDDVPSLLQRIIGMVRRAGLDASDLEDFDAALQKHIATHVRTRGTEMSEGKVIQIAGNVIAEIKPDADTMIGVMGEDADFPNCPKAVYAATHGEVA
jgi:hypothetical protein